jgi:Zn-finger domain-containing protein
MLQVNNDLIKETTELREFYESLQIDLISILNGVDIPDIDEKLSIDNFDSYFARLQAKYSETPQTSEQLDRRQRFLSVLRKAFQDYQTPT